MVIAACVAATPAYSQAQSDSSNAGKKADSATTTPKSDENGSGGFQLDGLLNNVQIQQGQGNGGVVFRVVGGAAAGGAAGKKADTPKIKVAADSTKADTTKQAVADTMKATSGKKP